MHEHFPWYNSTLPKFHRPLPQFQIDSQPGSINLDKINVVKQKNEWMMPRAARDCNNASSTELFPTINDDDQTISMTSPPRHLSLS
jgi:hypothetical protein